MVNTQGEPTFFQLQPVQNVGCQPGNSVDLFISKNDPDTYWGPGLVNASVHWIMHQSNNGQWNAIASLIHWDNPDPAWGFGQDTTINYVAQSQNAYSIVPSFFVANQQTTVTGYAQWYLDRNHQTNECLTDGGEKGPLFRWTSKFYLQNVTTPVYSGPALANEQFEGCSSPDQETEDSKACAHEKWYFAPNLGLVEIDSIWEGITLKRTTK